MDENKHPSAPKLSPAAKALVKQCIIAGESDDAIRMHLREAGYPHDLSRMALWHYRSAPDVVLAIERANVAACQTGMLNRIRRAEDLVDLYVDLRRRSKGETFNEIGVRVAVEEVETKTLNELVPQIVRVSDAISKLTDTPVGLRSVVQSTLPEDKDYGESEGADGADDEAYRRALQTFNDLLERELASGNVESRSAIAARTEIISS